AIGAKENEKELTVRKWFEWHNTLFLSNKICRRNTGGDLFLSIKNMKKTGKYRWLRRLLRVMVVLTGLLVIACLLFDHYVQFRKTDDELREIFAQRNIKGEIRYYEVNGRKIRYASVGEDTLPVLLMLHGSPGSMSYYSGRYADSIIQRTFKVYTVDRPGYGYSGFGDPEPSIEKQAAMIRPILDSLNRVRRPIIIAGGSYGASVACRIAMDYPHLVDGLMLSGPSLGPGLEVMFGITPVIEHWSLRWMVPRIFKSANTEKMHHRKELEKMLPLWKNIKVPVVYIQGEHDNIVDTANAGFARQHLVNVPYLDIRFIKQREHRLAQFEWPAIRDGIMTVYRLAEEKYDRQKGSTGP
ncbi:MAG TPA: alpha/beta hydrolase, partial [Chitinophagaceae bacterium]|nr:alpha/beta hydrolase [Chitinophagaceae bacterium]